MEQKIKIIKNVEMKNLEFSKIFAKWNFRNTWSIWQMYSHYQYWNQHRHIFIYYKIDVFKMLKITPFFWRNVIFGGQRKKKHLKRLHSEKIACGICDLEVADIETLDVHTFLVKDLNVFGVRKLSTVLVTQKIKQIKNIQERVRYIVTTKWKTIKNSWMKIWFILAILFVGIWGLKLNSTLQDKHNKG